MSSMLKVFVYGTLKVGGRFATRFDALRQTKKLGTIKGTMFSVNGSFPGLVLDGDTVIKGEVHEYERPAEVEKALDMIEGFRKTGDPRNLYNKVEVEVTTGEGTETCKVYVFARETDRLEKVATGEWKV